MPLQHDGRVTALAALIVGVVLLVTPASAYAQERRLLDTRVFARVGAPGHPEPIAIGPDGLIYVGTNRGIAPGPYSRMRSRIFAFDANGRLRRTVVIRGQELREEHGLQGLLFDGSGRLYALDRAAVRPRVIVIDPRTGRQRNYARFTDVPLCGPTRRTQCSEGAQDRHAGPDYAAFAPDGRMYVTDIDQGLIWRIARGGGRARVWFTDRLLDSPFGPNGIQFRRDGRTVLFAQTFSGDPQDEGAGLLLELRVRRDGRPGRLRRFYTSRPGDGPDGFAIARSGHVYLAMATGNVLVRISPQGREVARYPQTPQDNARLRIPFDAPASMTFLGRRLLVTNQSYVRRQASSFAVFDVWTGEPGIPLFKPVLGLPAAARTPTDARP
jgi:sugar lactone lactonase YvrE